MTSHKQTSAIHLGRTTRAYQVRSTRSKKNVTSEGWSLENHTQLLRPDPLLDWESFSEFDGQLHDFGEIDDGTGIFPDSTYGAIPDSFSQIYRDASGPQ